MTNMTYRLAVFFAGVMASPLALSQTPPGWTVTWGQPAVAVPVGPWVPVLTGLLLVAAAYSFLRKRQGQGLMALALAVIFGGLVVSKEPMAVPVVPKIEMDSPSDTKTQYCAFAPTRGVQPRNGVLYYYPYVEVLTTEVGGVTLLSISKIGSFTPRLLQQGMTECQENMRVTPGNPCYLPCPEEPRG